MPANAEHELIDPQVRLKRAFVRKIGVVPCVAQLVFRKCGEPIANTPFKTAKHLDCEARDLKLEGSFGGICASHLDMWHRKSDADGEVGPDAIKQRRQSDDAVPSENVESIRELKACERLREWLGRGHRS